MSELIIKKVISDTITKIHCVVNETTAKKGYGEAIKELEIASNLLKEASDSMHKRRSQIFKDMRSEK